MWKQVLSNDDLCCSCCQHPSLESLALPPLSLEYQRAACGNTAAVEHTGSPQRRAKMTKSPAEEHGLSEDRSQGEPLEEVERTKENSSLPR